MFSKFLVAFLKRTSNGIWNFFVDIKEDTKASIVTATKRGLLFLGRMKEQVAGLWNFFSRTNFLEVRLFKLLDRVVLLTMTKLVGLQARKPGTEKFEDVNREFLNCLLDITGMKLDSTLKLRQVN